MADGFKALKVIERLAQRCGCYIEMSPQDDIDKTINDLERWMDENPEWEDVKEEDDA